MNVKTKMYFGPSLAALTQNEKNTLEISGRLNRTAERYLGILEQYAIELTAPEIACLKKICMVGHMSMDEIAELPHDVAQFRGYVDGLDTHAFAQKLKEAPLVALIATVDQIGL